MSETQKQYEKILSVAYPPQAVGDIGAWMAMNEKCPNCDIKFSEMHPAQNLYTHWTGACTPNIAIAAANSAFQHKQESDPTVSALDALRQAVVAQTTLLRSLAEQVRTTSEMVCGVVWDVEKRLLIQFTGLAERLEKLERDNLVIASRLLSIEGKLPASEIRTTLARKQILLKDLQPKRAAARRKAKR